MNGSIKPTNVHCVMPFSWDQVTATEYVLLIIINQIFMADLNYVIVCLQNLIVTIALLDIIY